MSQALEGRRSIAQLPGPRAWPLVGHLLQLDLPQLHRQLEQWALVHGEIYGLKLLRKDVVVLSNPEVIAAVLRARPDTWRRPRNFEPIFREAGGHGLFSSEGDDWRRQRRLVMAAFDPTHLRSFMPHLARVTSRLKNRWDRAASAGTGMDLQAELMCYSVDAASALSYGVDINTIEDVRSELHQHLGAMFPMIYRRINMPVSYWHYVRLPEDRAYDRHVAAIQKTVRELVANAQERQRREPQRKQQPTDLLEAMLAARDADGSALSEEEIAANVFTMLVASEDTTADSLAWTIYLLHQHPAAWAKMVKEADDILGDEEVPPNIEQARSLVYAQACINESMRLRPVAPLLFFDAVKDTRIADVDVPAGTTLFCVMRAGAAGSSSLEGAQEFRPERWLDGDELRAAKRTSMPFGAGPRLCPGRYLAMLEMHMALGMLARNFELLEVATANGAPPVECLTFTMHPVGLKMRLARRRAPIG